MTLLTRESFLAGAKELPRELVDLRPHLDGEVYVRVLTGTERDAFEASNVKVTGKGRQRKTEPNPVNFRARLVALVCCGEDGKRLFEDRDAVELGRRSAAVLDRIVDVALRINGMTEEAVEEAEGNSEIGRNGTSTSPSPGTSNAPSENCSPASAPTS